MTKSLLQCYKIGESVFGQSIDMWHFSNTSQAKILIIGGVHGDEIEGIFLAEKIATYFVTEIKTPNFNKIKNNGIAIIPKFNPDGSLLNQRSNANDVDLNRNLPTKNWSSVASNPKYKPGHIAGSEIETKIFLNLISTLKPKFIISLHSYSKSLLLYPLYNNISKNYIKQTQDLANKINLEIIQEMDYSVFGSLSKFGIENSIATLTIELPRGENLFSIQKAFLTPIMEYIYEIID